jgi:tRNA 2-selenouridine synthase
VRGRRYPLLDVRSPKEFELGAALALGAASAPLLDNDERAEVGTLYKQVGKVEATQRGLELFAAKADRYLEDITRMAPPGSTLGIHCWRGGMRSALTASWLKAAGFDPIVVRGGYKAYRRTVLAALDAFAERQLLVLDGRTGSGKSDMLRTLTEQVPLVDFEGHARHRGSAFGDFAQSAPVPTQQTFENELAEAFLRLGDAPKILVEIENFIGPLKLPTKLRERIVTSPVVLIERDFDDRVERLASEYAAGWSQREDALFVERLKLLAKHVSRDDIARIVSATERRDFRTATALLLELRYDKVYDKGIAKRADNIIARFNLTHQNAEAISFIKNYFH